MQKVPKKTKHCNKNTKQQHKHTQILKIAWNLFLKNGYKKTNLQMIVKQTGGSLSTIYGIFGDKKNLFLQAINAHHMHFLESLDKSFAAIETSNLSLEKYFYRIGIQLLEQITNPENTTFLRLIIVEGYDNVELLNIFNQISRDRIRIFFLKGLEYYNNTKQLQIKDIEESARIFVHLIIEPFLLESIMQKDYQYPNKDEIERTVKRSVKIFMLYLKHYKEIE